MSSTTGNNKQQKSRLDQWLELKKPKHEISAVSDASLITKEIPLSFGQLRLWLLYQLHPESPFYNYAESYDINGNLTVDRLIESFKEIIARHDILRTIFPIHDDGRPFQKVEMDLAPEISTFGVTSDSTPIASTEADAILLKESVKPFDLAKGPLVRLVIVRIEKNRFKMAVVMHHIITDKWSMNILRKEWSSLYQGKPLGPVQLHYREFAHNQRNQQPNPSHFDYWQGKLAGDIPTLELPGAKPRTATPNYKGAFSEMPLDPEQSRKLLALANEFQTTGFILFLTIFKILLYRYTGLLDLLVASPITNRDQTKLEDVIGFFNETVVLRSQLTRDMTFADAVNQVKQTVLDAFAHKNVPFETLVSSLKPERLLGSNPLFQVMFLYHQTPNSPNLDHNITWSYQTMDLEVAKFDLTMYVAETDGQFTSIFEYATDKFDKSTIERMQGHLITLVDGILDNPQKCLHELPIMTKKERLLILSSWNDTDEDGTFNLIHELISNQAKENPEQGAIVFNNKTTSYGDLHTKANQIANALHNRGIGIGDHVGIAIARSPEMIIAILGVLYAGAAYVPLDINYPEARLHYMAEDSDLSMLLTTKGALGKFTEWGMNILLIDDLPPAERSLSDIPKPKASDTAYVIYTSGSSGSPKGVPVNHRNLASSTAARFSYYHQQPDSFLLLSSFSFDSSVAGIFWTLSNGGNLVLPMENAEQDILALSELIANTKVTHTLMLPSLYGLLLSHGPTDKLRSLNTVILAGEACPVNVCTSHFQKLESVNLYNEYGPTEGTVWSTVYQVPPKHHMNSISIGRPVGNTKAYILDDELQPVPVGVIGRLFLGGAGIVAGYLNQPTLTSKKFIDNPFSSTGGKMYDTGDLARFNFDGNIDFLGRSDQQIKIRGYRIEISEIRHVLESYPGIKEAVVILQDSYQEEKVDINDTEQLINLLKTMDPVEADYLLTSIETMEQFGVIGLEQPQDD